MAVGGTHEVRKRVTAAEPVDWEDPDAWQGEDPGPASEHDYGTNGSSHSVEPEGATPTVSTLGIWDAGMDNDSIPPRGWLLGNVFCRKFASSLIADGGVGKTAVRVAQLLSMASGRTLTGEHVFCRCKVLLICLEDDKDELRRRVKAAMIHHCIKPEDVAGHLFLSAPGARGGKLLAEDDAGHQRPGALVDNLRLEIKNLGIDIVSLDPFIKAHSVEENDNSAIDDVMQILTDLAAEFNIAVDVPHHTSKGPADPGNANRGRGASGMKDAARLVYTLSPMSPAEAELMGVDEAKRRSLIRLDAGKVNIAPPLDSAKWFQLVGVDLGNKSDLYPHGDNVQTVVTWEAPDTWAGLSTVTLNDILTRIGQGLEDGNRFTQGSKTTDRSAWKVVAEFAPDKTEPQAKKIINTWVANGVLTVTDYTNPGTRKPAKGLTLNHSKRPG